MSGPTTTVKGLQPYLDSIPYTDATADRAGEFGNPLILNKLFFLLTLMINSMQQAAAAQAQRLNFLTNWQNAYASQMNTIHVFTQGNGDNTLNPNGSTNSTSEFVSMPPDPSNASSPGALASTIRQDLNTTNTNYSTRLQSESGVVSNDAKSLQSAVNQTNDAVQSQSDLATGVLQQLQTILTSIYQNASA